MANYYIIHCSEDGDHSVQKMGEAELKTLLDEEYWGSAPIFITRITAECLDLCACSGLIIIKGDQVFPKPETVVKTWKV